MNIVLIGYRGSGKTTVGKKLAEKLNKRLVGTDELIIKRAGMSIPEIVEKSGWETFRNIESEVAKEVGRLDNCIIDAGGGIILKKINYNNLKRNGIFILLKADVKTIINRIKDDKERPSLTGIKSFIDEVEEVLKERNEKYEEAAEYIVDTTRLTVDEVADKIVNYINLKGS